MPQINKFKGLTKSYFYWNAWDQDESFDFKGLDNSQNDRLKELEIIEVLFDAESKEEDLLNPYIKFLDEYFASSDVPAYLFVTEFCKKQKSKLKSFKGILDKEDKNSEFTFELEVDLQRGYSLFGALVDINVHTNNLIQKFFFSNSNCFIINFGKKVEDKQQLIRHLISNYLIIEDNSTYLNYLELVLKFCPNKTIIYRTGGDGGSSEVSLQAFVTKETRDLVLMQIEMTI